MSHRLAYPGAYAKTLKLKIFQICLRYMKYITISYVQIFLVQA